MNGNQILWFEYIYQIMFKIIVRIGADRYQKLCHEGQITYSPHTSVSPLEFKKLSIPLIILFLNRILKYSIFQLINHINDFLMGDEPASLKDLCLKLLLIIATGLDNVSQNMLLEFIMCNSGLLFESLIHLLTNSDARVVHGQNALLLMSLLVQYRKYDSTNPYIVKLSILDEELGMFYDFLNKNIVQDLHFLFNKNAFYAHY